MGTASHSLGYVHLTHNQHDPRRSHARPGGIPTNEHSANRIGFIVSGGSRRSLNPMPSAYSIGNQGSRLNRCHDDYRPVPDCMTQGRGEQKAFKEHIIPPSPSRHIASNSCLLLGRECSFWTFGIW